MSNKVMPLLCKHFHCSDERGKQYLAFRPGRNVTETNFIPKSEIDKLIKHFNECEHGESYARELQKLRG